MRFFISNLILRLFLSFSCYLIFFPLYFLFLHAINKKRILSGKLNTAIHLIKSNINTHNQIKHVSWIIKFKNSLNWNWIKFKTLHEWKDWSCNNLAIQIVRKIKLKLPKKISRQKNNLHMNIKKICRHFLNNKSSQEVHAS